MDPLHSTVGLGFRASLAEALLASTSTAAHFVEISPENYIGVGGRRARLLARAMERFPVVVHGLAADVAGAAPIDEADIDALRDLLRMANARWYSDHLCLTHVDGAESHDLLPLPFTHEAVDRAALRIRTLRDRIELPIAVENVSAYLEVPGAQMSEGAFVRAVLEAADCAMLLDVNNVYVNAINFGFDARAFIDALPLERVVELHVAGHSVERVDDEGHPVLVIDTHGAPVIDPVFELLEFTLRRFAQQRRALPPILLERDHDIPPLPELEGELRRVRAIVDDVRGSAERAT